MGNAKWKKVQSTIYGRDRLVPIKLFGFDTSTDSSKIGSRTSVETYFEIITILNILIVHPCVLSVSGTGTFAKHWWYQEPTNPLFL